MPQKIAPDLTAGLKLLHLFRKLMLDGRRHFQLDLAYELQCSPQTVSRLIGEIESFVGTGLERGTEKRRRWYRIKTVNRSRLALDHEEIRYLSVCRDLAGSALPAQIRDRVDDTIFSLSVLLADADYAGRDRAQQPQVSFFPKGRIDYTGHYDAIEALARAIDERRICLVRYKASGSGEVKEHRFAPGRMAAMNGALYVLGAGVTEDFREFRHLTNFAVHRIQDVTVTDKLCSFTIPQADPGGFGLPWHEPRRFHIRFKPGKAADYVRERIWASEQRQEELEDGSLALEFVSRSEPEVMAWVRGFGEEAEFIVNIMQ